MFATVDITVVDRKFTMELIGNRLGTAGQRSTFVIMGTLKLGVVGITALS